MKRGGRSPLRQDLTGKKFGRWTVVDYAGFIKKKASWLCLCECGASTIVKADSLTMGKSLSCGCYRMEVIVTHNESHKKREYSIWHGMKSRCLNPKCNMYKTYGGRGITVCERWMSYENFLSDMGRMPSDSHSLDRINNELGYCPENCRWATKSEQATNRRNTVFVDFRGEKRKLIELCREFGKNFAVTRQRMRRDGWMIEECLAN
jgi:hypothetical protein